MKLQIKRLTDTARLPAYAHATDSGLDVCSDAEMVIRPGERACVPTGIAVALPPGTEAQIRPRSGLALKDGVTSLNTPGTIDEGYRGEVRVILINHGQADFHIARGDRIAQMVVCPVIRVDIEETDVLSDTDRGEGGFGSTGVRNHL